MRQDIQFLRGFAVSIVILNHAGFWPHSGFLGVDVFFVISGYLITGMLQKQIAENNFSFINFYTRRAKRLLPAAFTTFVLCAVAAPFFLGSQELQSFKEQVIGALTFSANMVLLSQAGYFDGTSELKPLLHIWSLAVEEQYYFFLPLFLFLLPRKYWIFGTMLVMLSSATLCAYLMQGHPDAAFYLLPTRAWEMGIGSMVALTRLDITRPRWAKVVFWPSFATILILPFMKIEFSHPGFVTGIICIATAVIIINQRAFFQANFLTRTVAWIGNPSYSLYLTHWPVIAFANNAYMGEQPVSVRIMLIAIGVALGLALYYGVERPIHKAKSFKPVTAYTAIIGVLVAVFLVPLKLSATSHANAAFSIENFRDANAGLDMTCSQNGRYTPFSQCQSSSSPTVALWGDSFAMHLAQALNASTDANFVQATRSACLPVLRYSQFTESGRNNKEWANGCIEFNDDVFASIVNSDNIDVVILASTFKGFTQGDPYRAMVRTSDNIQNSFPISEEQSLTALTFTIDQLRSFGKKVVIMAPPPSSRRDMSACLERRMKNLITFNGGDCSISIAEDRKSYGKETRMLERLSEIADVDVIDLREKLCTDTKCLTILNGIPLYRDWGHLSIPGSGEIGKQFDLYSKLVSAAK
ncbi:acyltransferase family protein [Brucella tritici]|uniref:acyltransferase family protein n=1 Tax=Brucella tritici TaxID=94626 RepID=UPI00200182DE|nr:acyltransferase family protein [Brucella tritici]